MVRWSDFIGGGIHESAKSYDRNRPSKPHDRCDTNVSLEPQAKLCRYPLRRHQGIMIGSRTRNSVRLFMEYCSYSCYAFVVSLSAYCTGSCHARLYLQLVRISQGVHHSCGIPKEDFQLSGIGIHVDSELVVFSIESRASKLQTRWLPFSHIQIFESEDVWNHILSRLDC